MGPSGLPRELCVQTEGRVGSVPGVQISVVGCKCVPLPNGMLQFSNTPSSRNRSQFTEVSQCISVDV